MTITNASYLIRQYLLTLITCLTITVGLAQGPTHVRTSVGGGISYSSELDKPGVNLRFQERVTRYFGFKLDANYFPPRKNTYDVDTWAFNLDGMLTIPFLRIMQFYSFTGLNLTNRIGDSSDDRSEFGLNAGAGLTLDHGRITPFIEGKRVFSDYGQMMFSAGIMIQMKRKPRKVQM